MYLYKRLRMVRISGFDRNSSRDRPVSPHSNEQIPISLSPVYRRACTGHTSELLVKRVGCKRSACCYKSCVENEIDFKSGKTVLSKTAEQQQLIIYRPLEGDMPQRLQHCPQVEGSLYCHIQCFTNAHDYCLINKW